jgi:hypothetical protein
MSNLSDRIGSLQSQPQAFAERYQYFLSIIATFLFFSYIPDYLHVVQSWPPPLNSIIIIAILSLPFIKKVRNVPKPILLWMGFYLGISVLSLLTVSSDEISFTDFRTKVLSCLFILLMYANFQQKSITHIRYVFIAVVLLSVVNNFIELFNPRIFTAVNVGRPAGLYIDPNQAGCAIMLGTIFGITAIPKQYRWILMAISGIGIAMTFSRGAIIGWVICLFIMTLGKVLSDRPSRVIAPALVVLLLLVSIDPLASLTDYFKSTDENGSNYGIVNRLEEFQNPSLKEDSAADRQVLAASGWMMFSEQPFWGNGLASTRKWNISEVSTHNMYLYFMADNGILGLIFLPGAVIAFIYNNRGESRPLIISFAVFISVWGFFSHEVLAERYTLSSFAFLAAMNTNQKWYLKYTNGNIRIAPPLLEPKQLRLPAPRHQKFWPRNPDRS